MAASGASFRVTNPQALYRAADPAVAHVGKELIGDTQARTPRRTGRLAAGWRLVRNRDASYSVTNDVPYARFVEYGTKHTPARAMLGQAAAKARSTYGR